MIKIRIELDHIESNRFVDDMELCAGDPRREHLPNGGIKAKAGIFGGSVLFRHLEGIIVPVGQIDKRLVLDHDTLRLSSRSRCVNHISEIRWFDRNLNLVRFSFYCLFYEEGMTCERRWCSELFLNQKDLCPAIFQHVGNALRWIIGINRHECRTCLENSENSGCHLERWTCENADAVSRFCAAGNQFCGDCIRPVVQFFIRPACAAEGCGFLMRYFL
ncbi:hypothetical protein BAME_33810 [Bacillus sp. M 2-6]|nr:hypothetical protein BAME_33810 [Bacillus sp. M 2-6]